MAFTHAYPGTDFNEYNLDWVIRRIREVTKIVDDFTVINQIKWMGEWDISNAYPQWSIVDDNGNGYLAIQPVPRNININNTDYWQLVADYSSLYAAYGQRITDLETAMTAVQADITALFAEVVIKNVMTIPGVDNTGSTDNFQILQDYITDHRSGPLRLYFPAGTYNISDTLTFPDNCEVFGDGESTYIYLTVSGNWSGGVIGMAGSNIWIHDLGGGYLGGDSELITNGSMMGFAGTGTRTYDASIDHDASAPGEDHKNNIFERIYTDCQYVIQTETIGDGHKCTNVFYKDIDAPDAMLSVQPGGNDEIADVYISNCKCSVLRLGRGYEVAGAIFVDNLLTNQICVSLATTNVFMSNVKVLVNNTSKAYVSNFYSYYDNAAVEVIGSAIAYLSNFYIDCGSSLVAFGVVAGSGTTIHIDGSEMVGTATATYLGGSGKIYASDNATQMTYSSYNLGSGVQSPSGTLYQNAFAYGGFLHLNFVLYKAAGFQQNDVVLTLKEKYRPNATAYLTAFTYLDLGWTGIHVVSLAINTDGTVTIASTNSQIGSGYKCISFTGCVPLNTVSSAV